MHGCTSDSIILFLTALLKWRTSNITTKIVLNRCGRQHTLCELFGNSTHQMEFSAKQLKELCRKNGGYSTPSLNESIYLQYKGLRVLPDLTEYTGLKSLWAEGNGLSCISGIESCKELTGMYLQHNCIDTIENLQHCVSFPPQSMCPCHSVAALCVVVHAGEARYTELIAQYD